MREFILKASKAFTSAFNLNDLPSAGRMDVVCRCVSNAIFVSNVIRGNTNFHTILEGPARPPKLISFFGKHLEEIAPDERKIASIIKNALKLGLNLKKNEERIVSPGVEVAKKGFGGLIEKKRKTHQLIYLHPKGTDIHEFDFKEDICFVLGDHRGLPKNAERLLDRLGAVRISVGRPVYLSSHVVVICQNELDRRATESA